MSVIFSYAQYSFIQKKTNDRWEKAEIEQHTFSCTSRLAANISSIRVVFESVDIELHRMITFALPPPPAIFDDDEDDEEDEGAIGGTTGLETLEGGGGALVLAKMPLPLPRIVSTTGTTGMTDSGTTGFCWIAAAAAAVAAAAACAEATSGYGTFTPGTPFARYVGQSSGGGSSSRTAFSVSSTPRARKRAHASMREINWKEDRVKQS